MKMTKRLTLVEQKKIQWAKEKEEMTRLNNHWDLIKHQNPVRTTIRTRLSSREQSSSCNQKIVRASGQYGSTTSLQSLEFSAGGSMINILDRNEFTGTMTTTSPSLPPIYTKENHHHHQHANNTQKILQLKGDKTTRDAKYLKNGSSKNMPYELEREDETSGYASDSIEAPVISHNNTHQHQVNQVYPTMIINNDNVMSSEKTWKNPYCEMSNTTTTTTAGSMSETSRGCSITRLGDINRQRWESVWQGESSKDPPQHSWLERGLSRLDNSSQILVINHENTSSPDSSTTGSSNCDLKTYLRGHNIPVDIHILEERELRRKKALQLQNAIKQQLEENDKKRKEEKMKKQQEEYEEEERIKKEIYLEKKRLEQEEKIMKEKQDAKIKKEEAMKKIIENAEKLAKEEKRNRRQVNEEVNDHLSSKATIDVNKVQENQSTITTTTIDYTQNNNNSNNNSQEKIDEKIKENINININNEEKNINNKDLNFEILDNLKMKNLLRLPSVNKEVAIVLTGRLDDSELLNLIVNTKSDLSKNNYYSNSIISEFIKYPLTDSSCSPKDKSIEYRLLTPSKYRSLMTARECATQTDTENAEIFNQKKNNNNNRKNNEKSTNTSTNEEKFSRSKSQPRASIDSRPRWNANRPGTRYRTQSEKDPHYQRRLRMRRRRIESSDDRSRSPSSERRKINNIKLKIRNLTRRNMKNNNHSDADLSMDSLNSIVPLRIDENGKINVHHDDDDELIIEKNKINNQVDSWHGHDIISQLVTLKNGLLAKQQEWNSERCLISPSADIY